MSSLPHDWFPRDLPRGVTLGKRSFLYSSFAFLHCDSTAFQHVLVGDDSGIYHGTFFEIGPAACVEIGSFSTIVGAILRVEQVLRIGNYVFVAHEVVISDCDELMTRGQLPSRGLFPSASCRPRCITIEDDVWIGMRAIILAGVTIGAGAIVGAGAVVSNDVPPMTIVSGNPARVVRDVPRSHASRKQSP